MRQKVNARMALNSAVYLGKLKKPKQCQRCGLEEIRVEGHHTDYSKALTVEWLCTSCHAAADRAMI